MGLTVWLEYRNSLQTQLSICKIVPPEKKKNHEKAIIKFTTEKALKAEWFIPSILEVEA